MLLLLSAFVGGGCVTSVDVDIDGDKDGLVTSEEETIGTDPEVPDSDGDGFVDGDEVASYTDPTDSADKPYKNGWTIDSCRHDVTGEGTEVGQVSTTWELQDQFEETFRIADFCNQVIVVENAGFT